jgi:hypothetical protein
MADNTEQLISTLVRAPRTRHGQMIARAERHGLTPTARLVEYAAFIVSGTIKLKPMIVPNFHFYLHEDFVERWTAADAQVAVS